MASLTAGTDQDIPAYDSEDLCPVCQSNRYLNPNMKFLVSSCHHRLCEDCVENIFGGGPSKCPVCQLVIRKGSFYRQLFEDLTVEKEIRVRKRVARTFNKRETDFKTLRDYNDYLEFVEEIVFNLTNDVNIQETEGIIEDHERKNREAIKRNNSRQDREKMLTQLQLEQEKREKSNSRKEYLQRLKEEGQAKKSAKSSFINELATSDKNAEEIVQTKMAVTQREQEQKKRAAALGKGRYSGSGLSSRLDELHRGMNGLHESEEMDIEDEVELHPEFFDPHYSPYKPVSGVNVRPQYQDSTQALRNPVLSIGGYMRDVHSRYLLEAAMTGVLTEPPKEK